MQINFKTYILFCIDLGLNFLFEIKKKKKKKIDYKEKNPNLKKKIFFNLI